MKPIIITEKDFFNKYGKDKTSQLDTHLIEMCEEANTLISQSEFPYKKKDSFYKYPFYIEKTNIKKMLSKILNNCLSIFYCNNGDMYELYMEESDMSNSAFVLESQPIIKNKKKHYVSMYVLEDSHFNINIENNTISIVATIVADTCDAVATIIELSILEST